MSQTTDNEIRKAFHEKMLASHHDCPNTIVIDELGVAHGKNRIDIAVVNGCIHGYEIKSSKDNLSRFPSQLEAYEQCFERLSVVSAENHIEQLIHKTPEWCGIILAEKGPRGGIKFSTIRRSKKNPDVDIEAMAHFLWKKEAIELLMSLGADKDMLKGARTNLYKNLSKLITIPELSSRIKSLFMSREEWRAAL
ncbi:MAG: sce7726 family protein [Gammaproteobacteria bacterium]|nr:sce7726 family protein [Gammaproteobacteria bacterium]